MFTGPVGFITFPLMHDQIPAQSHTPLTGVGHNVLFVQAGVVVRVLPQPSDSFTVCVPAPPPQAPEHAPVLVGAHNGTQAQAALFVQEGVVIRVAPQLSVSTTVCVPRPPPQAPEHAPLLVSVHDDDTQEQAGLVMLQASLKPVPLPKHVHVSLPLQAPAL